MSKFRKLPEVCFDCGRVLWKFICKCGRQYGDMPQKYKKKERKYDMRMPVKGLKHGK